MKKHFIIISLLLMAGIPAFTQCDKKVTWTAPKAEFMDEAGNIKDTKQVKVTVRTTRNEITITHSDDENDSLYGTVKEFTCNWKEAFKNGKTVLKVDMVEKNSDHHNCTVTIEGTGSKISILIQMEDPDGKKKLIRIPVDSYKEE